jgi:hypothetical protein
MKELIFPGDRRQGGAGTFVVDAQPFAGRVLADTAPTL